MHEVNGYSCWCQNKGIIEGDTTILVHQDCTWRGQRHSFIDDLAEGNTVESYFESL